MRYPWTRWRALSLGCLLLAAVAAGCGGDGSADDATQSVQVEASNTAAGRFPDEELVRAQDQAAAAEQAAEAASEELAPVAAEPAEPANLPDPSETPDPAASAIEGIPAGPLEPGRYASVTFEPGFALEVDPGWLSFQPELEDFIALSPADDLDLSVSFLSPRLATALIDDEGEYTDQDPSEEQLLDPLAFDYFDWIHEHPHYEAGEIRSELLAGRAVASFDATLTSGYAWKECLSDCALLVAVSDGELLAQEVGYRERLYTTTVADLTFVVSIAAPKEKFDAFVARAVALLSTLELVADIQPSAPAPTEAPAVPADQPSDGDPAPVEEPPPAEDPAPVEEPAPGDDPALDVEPERLPPAPLES